MIEKVIGYLFSEKFNINDPLSGFKIYKASVLYKMDLNKIKNFFLVDLLIQFCKKDKKILSLDIVTRPRKDKPRIGNIFKVNLKMLKILRYIISIKAKI